MGPELNRIFLPKTSQSSYVCVSSIDDQTISIIVVTGHDHGLKIPLDDKCHILLERDYVSVQPLNISDRCIRLNITDRKVTTAKQEISSTVEASTIAWVLLEIGLLEPDVLLICTLHVNPTVLG